MQDNGNDKPAPGKWPFGLTVEQERRAAAIMADNIMVDMMTMHVGGSNIFDAIPQSILAEYELSATTGGAGFFEYTFLPYRLAIDGKSDAIRKWWDDSNITLGTLSFIMGGPRDILENVRSIYLSRCDKIFESLDWLRKVEVADDIRRAKRDGAHAVYYHSQPTRGLNLDLTEINDAYELGLRCQQLAYNRMDFVGAGCADRYDSGLSNFGLEIVRRCNDLGIIVDTSHCSRQTTLDACKFSKTPVTANHNGIKALYEHDRSKSDDELKAVADTGGVFGIVAVPFFLSDEERPNMELMLDQIDYAVDLIGPEHVGIGTDWPFQNPNSVVRSTIGAELESYGFDLKKHKIDVTKTLRGYEDSRDFPNIVRGLVSRNYSEEDIIRITGGNFMRVFESVCG